MTEDISKNQASRIIDVIDQRIARKTRSLAMVESTWGEVAARDTGALTVDVYLYGSATASEGFRVIAGGCPLVGAAVKVAIDKARGDRWVMEPIVGLSGSTIIGDVAVLEDGISVVANVASIDARHGLDVTSGGAGIARIAVDEAELDHGGFSGLGDDDHPQYDTHAEVLATKLDDFATPDDNTDLNATSSYHGLMPKLSGSSADRFKGNGTFAVDNVGLNFMIDGGGFEITTGIKGWVEVPFAGTIVAARLLADQSGSIVIDIWKDTYANYPPTIADTITSATPPTITTATKSEDTTLSGWTISIAAGDILLFNVNSVTTITRVILALTIRRD